MNEAEKKAYMIDWLQVRDPVERVEAYNCAKDTTQTKPSSEAEAAQAEKKMTKMKTPTPATLPSMDVYLPPRWKAKNEEGSVPELINRSPKDSTSTTVKKPNISTPYVPNDLAKSGSLPIDDQGRYNPN